MTATTLAPKPASSTIRSAESCVSSERGTRMARVSSGHIQYQLEGDGPVVLALHGGPAGSDQSMLFNGDFTENGFSLLAPSRPGYLGTALTVGRTVAQQAEAMIELADHLGIAEFFITAFSCGAASAVHLAAKYPHRVRGMILESPVTQSFKHELTRGLHGQLLLSEMGSAILRQLIARAPLYCIKRLLERESTYGPGVRLEARKIYEDETKRRHAIQIIEHCLPAGQRLAGLMNDAKHLEDFDNPELAKVQCPTLIFHGLNDGEVPFHHGDNAAKKIKNSKLIPVPNACHILFLSDRWELIKKARRKFFDAIIENVPDPFNGIAMR